MPWSRCWWLEVSFTPVLLSNWPGGINSYRFHLIPSAVYCVCLPIIGVRLFKLFGESNPAIQVICSVILTCFLSLDIWLFALPLSALSVLFLDWFPGFWWLPNCVTELGLDSPSVPFRLSDLLVRRHASYSTSASQTLLPPRRRLAPAHLHSEVWKRLRPQAVDNLSPGFLPFLWERTELFNQRIQLIARWWPFARCFALIKSVWKLFRFVWLNTGSKVLRYWH